MKVEAGLPTNDLHAAVRAAQRLEALGYDTAVTPEMKNDPFLPLAVAAVNTERLGLATTAVIAFPRSPMITALTAWDLQRASKGRFMLGLATQVKGHNERRYSTPWVGPAQPRMRDYVKAVRAIWNTWQTGAKLDHHGKYYTFTLMTPEFSPGPIEGGPPKITVTAVVPNMARLAGEVADGIRIHPFSTAKYVRDVVLPELRIGAERAGRDLADLEITGGGFIVTGATQAEVEQNLEEARRRVSFYGSTRTYHGVFEAHGWSDLGPRLHEMSLKGQWSEMPKVVPDDVVAEFAVTGTYDEIIPRILARYEGIANRVSFSIPTRTPADEERLKEMIRELQGAGVVAAR